MIAAVSGADRALGRGEIAERHLVEAVDDRPEPVEIFLLTAGGERRQRAAVKRTFEGDDAIALRPSARRLILAGGLDRTFAGFRPGIAEKDHVGEARGAQPLGGPFVLGNVIEVGDVPELFGLVLQRLDQVRMRMAQRIHRDPGGKVEVALTIGRVEPNAFAPLESEVNTREGRHQVRCHGFGSQPQRQ